MTIVIMKLHVFLPKNPCMYTDIMSNSTPLDFLFTLLTADTLEDIFIYTHPNLIKLLYYVDNYVLGIVAKCWAVVLIIVNANDDYIYEKMVYFFQI